MTKGQMYYHSTTRRKELILELDSAAFPIPSLNTSYHEAGHAVANVILGFSIILLTRKEDENGNSGTCQPDSLPDSEWKLLNKEGKVKLLEKYIVSLLAAQFSEALTGTLHRVGVIGDIGAAAELAMQIIIIRGDSEKEWLRNVNKVDEILIPLSNQAKELINNHELAVIEVARKLEFCDTFEGVLAQTLVENALSTYS